MLLLTFRIGSKNLHNLFFLSAMGLWLRDRMQEEPTNLQQLKDQEPMQIIILMIQRYACSKIRKVAEAQ